MLRISATTLESFRLYMQQEWMPEAELLATVKGEFAPTRRVLIGRAFGKVLETPDLFRVSGGFVCDGFSFDDKTMAPCLALTDHRYGIFEGKGSAAYGDCTVVAKADQIVGARLFEHKATLGDFDSDKYQDSYQWRFMADIFQPSSVTYHCFRLDDHGNGVISLNGIDSITVYPYLGLHDDCAALVRDFRAYVVSKGLDGLLRDRQRQWEAA